MAKAYRCREVSMHVDSETRGACRFLRWLGSVLRGLQATDLIPGDDGVSHSYYVGGWHIEGFWHDYASPRRADPQGGVKRQGQRLFVLCCGPVTYGPVQSRRSGPSRREGGLESEAPPVAGGSGQGELTAGN